MYMTTISKATDTNGVVTFTASEMGLNDGEVVSHVLVQVQSSSIPRTAPLTCTVTALGSTVKAQVFSGNSPVAATRLNFALVLEPEAA